MAGDDRDDRPAGTVRVRLDLGYDGTAFRGWATQPDQRTVQAELEAALTTVLRHRPVQLTVAGRTDAGVHARGQVSHFDLPLAVWAQLPGRSTLAPGPALVRRLNGLLADDVVVHRASEVSTDFDARFAALSRRYSYRIANADAVRDPLRRADTAVVRESLDLAALQQASARLTGLHDFAAFCKLADGRSTIRTLLDYSWRRDAEGTLVATVAADAFCHSMVRFLIGVAVPVGAGRRPPDWPAEVLASGRRDGAVQLMPAHGLCLEEVRYPPEAEWAERVAQTRSVRTPEELTRGPDRGA